MTDDDHPRSVQLMRLLLPERRIDVMVMLMVHPRYQHYTQLWQYIGGSGIVHPHPRTRLWIQYADAPALQTSDAHLCRGED